MFINVLTSKAKSLLYSTTLLVMFSILVGSFFSYVLQFLLARTLTVQDYGTFNALLSVVYLVSVPTGVFGTAIIKVSSELLAKKKFDKITVLFWKLVGYASLFGFVLFSIIFIFRNNLANYLNINDVSVLVPFGMFLGLSYISIIPISYLQGLLRFKAFSLNTILIAFLRMVLPVFFVLLGFGISGVFYGFCIMVFLSICISYLLLKKNLGNFKETNLEELYKRLLYFSSSILFINFGLMALNNLDMIMVKKLFDSTTAGYYAGTVTLGKMFLFGATTVSTVMFPQISNLYTQKSKLLYPKFKKFFYLQIFLVVLGLAVFFMFPNILTSVFFGDRFTNSVEHLPLFSVFMALYILINFFVLFFMAIEKTKVFIFLILAVVAQYILFMFFNSSIGAIINVNILVSFLLLTALSIYFLRVKKSLIY